jgi:hypothetical protein
MLSKPSQQVSNLICCGGHEELLTPYRYGKDKALILSMLKSGCEFTNDEFDEHDIAEWFLAKKVKVWLGFDNKDSTKINHILVNNVVGGTTLNILMWCGEAKDWDLVWWCMNEIAKLENCKDISIRGRRGFMRRFKNHGIKEKYTIMTMEVV